jgi:sulfur carrier protein ThiS
MTVAELIEILKTMPQDVMVEVNDNRGGEVYNVEQVDHFEADDDFEEVVVIQVNV